MAREAAMTERWEPEQDVAFAMAEGTAGRYIANLSAHAARPEAQGRGIGDRHHDTLLAHLANRTAILDTNPGDAAAMRRYRGRGRRVLRGDYRFPGRDRLRAIMGRDLAGL